MKFLQDKIFLEKRNDYQHYFFSVNKDEGITLSWDTIIECLNFNVANNLPVKLQHNFGIVLHDFNNIEIIKKILKAYSQLDTYTSSSAHVYISLTSVSSTFGRHKDTSDVLFWQGIGSTKWIVEEGLKTFTYILKPNDFIYIPKTMYHTVIPLTPRVGISFGLDY